MSSVTSSSRREPALPAVATNQHSARDHVLHGCCCLLGLPLLGEGEDSIDEHYESDGDGQLRQSSDEGQSGRHPKQDREEVGELGR